MALNFGSNTTRWIIIAAAAFLVVLLTSRQESNPASTPTSSAPPSQARDLPFDFYVLALSWSPAFCASQAGNRSPQQCEPEADFGFITHGLWPQFEQGWPSFCQSEFGDQMPYATTNELLPIMPDRGLIQHQWDKHGTCSGLSQQIYAEKIIAATDRTTIPTIFEAQPPSNMDAREIERAFQQANPAIPADAIAITCPNGRLAEVRICYDHDLSPRTCREVDQNGCTQSGLTITQR